MVLENYSNIFIFGAGTYGLKTKRLLDDYKNIIVDSFIDNNEKKCGLKLDGKPIVSLNTVKEKIDDKTAIIVAMKDPDYVLASSAFINSIIEFTTSVKFSKNNFDRRSTSLRINSYWNASSFI